MSESFKNGFIKAAMAKGMSEGQAVDFLNWAEKHSAASAQPAEKKASAADQLVETIKQYIK